MVPGGSSRNFIQELLGNLNQTKFSKNKIFEYVELSRKKKGKYTKFYNFPLGFHIFGILAWLGFGLLCVLYSFGFSFCTFYL